jgi:hypothetical protein
MIAIMKTFVPSNGLVAYKCGIIVSPCPRPGHRAVRFHKPTTFSDYWRGVEHRNNTQLK